MRIEIKTNRFPRLTAWHVRRILKWIEPTDLEGLDRIRLIDYEPNDPEASKQPPYLVGFLYCGAYNKAKGTRPASICLYTHDLYFGIPKLLAASPLARLKIARTLAHEVGHHAMVSRGYVGKLTPTIKLNSMIDSERERAATAYSKEVVTRMLASPYFGIGKLLALFCSYFYFRKGDRAHWRGDFKRAAEYEFCAYMLNTDNTDAWQAYLQDRQAILDKTPTALTDAERLWIFHRRSPQAAK